MTDWQHSSTEDWLERGLQGLAAEITFPATPTFTMPHSAPAPSRPVRLRWRIALAVAACVLALLAIPDVRHVTANLLGLPAIRIEFGDQAADPPTEVTSIGDRLLLGDPSSFEAASEQFNRPILVPGDSLSDTAPEIYLNRFQGVPVVNLLYPASESLPEIGSTGVGLLVMAIDDDGSSRYLITKRATGETPPLAVSVNGNEGFWIEGGVLTVDTGNPFWTYHRRSGNVLVWYQDGITYRIESALPLDATLDIASSLEPRGTDRSRAVYQGYRRPVAGR